MKKERIKVVKLKTTFIFLPLHKNLDYSIDINIQVIN